MIGIDGNPINSDDDLGDYLNGIDYQKNVTLQTDKANYSLELRFDFAYERYMIGLYNTRTVFCPIYA